MNLQNMTTTFQKPFAIEKWTICRTVVYLGIGAGLSLVRIPVSTDLWISMWGIVLFLSLYTLPIGWALLASIPAVVLSYMPEGQVALMLGALFILLVAAFGGKALYSLAGGKGIKSLLLLGVWVIFAQILGWFYLSIVFEGVLLGLLRVVCSILEWSICLIFSMLLVTFAKPEQKLKQLWIFMGLIECAQE